MKLITHVTHKDILDDLGFSPTEAENIKIRAELMREIKKYIQTHRLTQGEAAKFFGIDQARISKLLNGHIELFTVDKLINLLSKTGIHITLKLAA